MMMMDDFCGMLQKDYPYLPSIIFQLVELSDQHSFINELLSSSIVKRMKETDPYFRIRLQPVDKLHITQLNKKLVSENEIQAKKIQMLTDMVGSMRKDYNRELSNKHS